MDRKSNSNSYQTLKEFLKNTSSNNSGNNQIKAIERHFSGYPKHDHILESALNSSVNIIRILSNILRILI